MKFLEQLRAILAGRRRIRFQIPATAARYTSWGVATMTGWILGWAILYYFGPGPWHWGETTTEQTYVQRLLPATKFRIYKNEGRGRDYRYTYDLFSQEYGGWAVTEVYQGESRFYAKVYPWKPVVGRSPVGYLRDATAAEGEVWEHFFPPLQLVVPSPSSLLPSPSVYTAPFYPFVFTVPALR